MALSEVLRQSVPSEKAGVAPPDSFETQINALGVAEAAGAVATVKDASCSGFPIETGLVPA